VRKELNEMESTIDVDVINFYFREKKIVDLDDVINKNRTAIVPNCRFRSSSTTTTTTNSSKDEILTGQQTSSIILPI
jgi:hypothetical protein